MINEAIILAGGLGTRLRESVPDLPKCMAPVAGRPFLFYVINYLRSQGITRFIFSLGFKHEIIETWLADQFNSLDYQIVVEEEPLGTGGAIALACQQAHSENILVTNGDTLFRIQLAEMATLHLEKNADATLALKPLQNFDRYGLVELNEDSSIREFHEKKFCAKGLINGGSYLLNKKTFLANKWPPVFSFEKNLLESHRFRLFGSVQDHYFIDIGIPEDYQRAQQELKRPALDLRAIDKSWTLFIDRDGVVNPEKKEDYIRNWNEFSFYDGVKDAFKQVAHKFGKICIVSNQRGVGKKWMTENDLLDIHQRMKAEIEGAGGRVDGIYYCTSTDNKHPDRKPNPGMAFRAMQDHPDIDPGRSIMVGNKPSDMLFGRNAGMYSVFLSTTNPDTPFPHPDIDLRFNSLPDFAKAL